ncbi:MAG: DNA-directed RNA polymerase subunit beta [Candidatus Omnitrophica bacterium]|nr:DNA-directed RNA polymerase subunit beta [Candidatus Omnitrophota bacterium]
MIKRISFARLSESLEPPDLIAVQRDSYEQFLQLSLPRSKRETIGLQAAFLETFPIENADGTHRMEFLHYAVGRPKYRVGECLRNGLSYAAPLKVKLRLVSPKEAKEQEVYFGEIPLMTESGTFVINGDERVVVSQLHRSPGVTFEVTVHPTGKRLFSARVIPYHGAWVELDFDIADVLHVSIDRRRKMVGTIILRALGFSTDEEILEAFAKTETVEFTEPGQLKALVGNILGERVTDPRTGQILIRAGVRIEEHHIETIWAASGGEASQRHQLTLVLDPPAEILKTIEKDHTTTREEALLEIFRRLRPGDLVNLPSAETLIQRLFLDPRRYDLGRVGRFVLNRKLGLNDPLDQRLLTGPNVIAVIRYLLGLRRGEGEIDDIDHLGSRRVRSVGELVYHQFRVGLERLERTVRERMAIYDLDKIMPHSLINFKLVASVVRDFFARSQLSQFLDQTNPLAELTHKRRLSALGPGGLSRERAGFEVRDVHHSHYGRICPIETPEGPNIGLISSLTVYARINEHGFIETPYRKVKDGAVTKEVDYFTADVEDRHIIAQASTPLTKSGRLAQELVSCRWRGNIVHVPPEQVEYMDVSPNQIVSIAASLVPFLEHDDANRALMGSNMQRQAVPLMVTESPLVGTGIEGRVARDSGSCAVAKDEGTVSYVDGERILIGRHTYELKKFQRSNANTSINQRPLVRQGQKVKAGQVIADGASTHDGELALGRNVLVAFLPWRGYNFEDAILISEKLVKEDTFTSIHIEEFEVEARETRLGNEEVTRDIPNVGEEALKDLDEQGIVRAGAKVGPRDILVGKVTPKSETELTPEEKLLKAIFGEKAEDVRDTSLRVPAGVEGIVVDVKILVRKGARAKTKEEQQEEHRQIEAIRKQAGEQVARLREELGDKLVKLLGGKTLASPLTSVETDRTLFDSGRTIKPADKKKLLECDLTALRVADDPSTEAEIRRIVDFFEDQIREVRYMEEIEADKIKRGDELPPGVLKRVVVRVASKRNISVGDKMAGRHGNKGVIAKIVPQEDMPFMPDGTPVEVVLNPLGVPSRMNVGQILELHLGWAAKVLGYQIDSPVFDGANEDEIKEQLKKARLPEGGKIHLRDGRSGEAFDQAVAVGYLYMIKLVHLVDDKIHARSIGPYSLVTQQPLGGKAQFGGQRFGEMEVWALEAYGAAYTLQELLTVKSDDVVGRTRVYESIVKGEHSLQPSVPESFNVLVKELQGLSLDVRLERKEHVVTGAELFEQLVQRELQHEQVEGALGERVATGKAEEKAEKSAKAKKS